MARVSFREQVLRAREDAIVASVNRLLAEKGFDLMTVDEVASDVGIAKASLYKHFTSKEELAAAAMVRALRRTLERIDALNAQEGSPALERLRGIVGWAVQVQLAGEMPSLPSQNSSLRQALTGNKVYMDLLFEVSDKLGAWIEEAQAQAALNPALPAEVVLYMLFARACDPVAGVLRAGGQYSDEQIIEFQLAICFDGLRGRPG